MTGPAERAGMRTARRREGGRGTARLKNQNTVESGWGGRSQASSNSEAKGPPGQLNSEGQKRISWSVLKSEGGSVTAGPGADAAGDRPPGTDEARHAGRTEAPADWHLMHN